MRNEDIRTKIGAEANQDEAGSFLGDCEFSFQEEYE